MTREQIEQHLRDYLGVEKVIWLAKGIDPDETNGHVDDVACFARPGVVLAAVTEDEDDWRYELLQDNLRVLRAATDARGRTLEVHTVPMPAIMEITEEEAWGIDSAEGSIPRRPGDKTAASYLNFLIVNGGIILPTFDDPNDDGGARDRRRGLPRARGGHGARPGDRPRRRQRALHHAAAASRLRRQTSESGDGGRPSGAGRRRRSSRPPRVPHGDARVHHLQGGAPPATSSLPQGSQSVSSR